MPVYINESGKLKELKEQPLKLEKEIQQVFESNLSALTGLTLVKSEFTIRNRRIDTLAYDEQNKAFIIIEYKRDRNNSVFDQGVTYLNLMLENKADFIIEYNERFMGRLQRNDVDWSQSRVVFVSTSFTDNQRQAVNFKDFGIELWEIRNFENNIVQINSLKKTASAPSIKDISGKSEILDTVKKEIKEYTEEDLLKNSTDEIKELYEQFKAGILNLSEGIEPEPKKLYMAFKKGRNIADIELQRNSLKLFINLKQGQLDDSKKIMRDVSKVGHYGNGDYEIRISDNSQLEYILSLVKQAL
jgi:predicted transport protein